MKARLLARSAMALTVTALVGSASGQEGLRGEMELPYRSLTFEGGAAEIPIELARSQILVDGVRVNGEGPFRFVLDTGGQGAGRIDSSVVERLGLEPSGQVMGSDGTGRQGRAMDMFRLESLTLGGLRAEGVRVLSRDYNADAAVAARGEVDGILGIDFFDEVLLTIDYPGKVLRLESGALPEPDEREVLALVEGRPIPTVRLELAGELHEAYLDSGAMGPLTLPGALEDSLPLDGEPQVVGQARTVTGAFEIRAATVDAELVIGRHVTYRPRVMFGGPVRDVIVGGEVMAEFAITIDQKNDRVRFLRGGIAAHGWAPARTSLLFEEQRVPMKSLYGRPVIEAMIEGRGPFEFVLDTGAADCLLSMDLVEELGLEVTGETRIGVPGGEQRVPARMHSLSEVTVGDARFEGVKALSWDVPEIMDALGGARGIIGLPLFHDLLVTLDTPAGELVLSHGSLPEDATPYRIDESGLPEVQIDVAGRALPAHIDTGNPSALGIPASAVKGLPLAYEPQVVGRARTASGETEIKGAPLEGNAKVVGIVLEKPMLYIHTINEFANIGGSVFEGRALSWDQRSRRLQVGEPREQGERAVVRKASGKRGTYGVMLGMTNVGPIELRGVVPGSVAEKAGLKKGDSIVALNGVDVDELDVKERGAAFRAPTLKLTVLRDGERLEFSLAHETEE